MTQTTPTGTIDNCPYCDAYTPPGGVPHLCPKQASYGRSPGTAGFICAEGFRLIDADDYLRMLCMRIEAFTKQKNTNDWANVWQAYIDCQLFLRRCELDKEAHNVRI